MCADSLCRAGTVLGTRGDSFLICIGVTIPLDRQLNLPRVSLIARSRTQKVTCILATAGMRFHYTMVLIYNKHENMAVKTQKYTISLFERFTDYPKPTQKT